MYGHAWWPIPLIIMLSCLKKRGGEWISGGIWVGIGREIDRGLQWGNRSWIGTVFYTS